MNENRDIEESERVAGLVGVQQRQCYLNAAQVIWSVPEYRKADYVEGYVVVGGKICIEHGWVEQDGVVIDPTLTDGETVYFPALRFKGSFGIAEAMQIPKKDGCEDLPIFYRFGWGGIDSPEFRAATVAAYRYAGMEEIASRYEQWGSRTEAVI